MDGCVVLLVLTGPGDLRAIDTVAEIFMADLQVAAIEFARNILDLKEADSAEFNPATSAPVVVFMPEISTTHKGGTMRLGSRRFNFLFVM